MTFQGALTAMQECKSVRRARWSPGLYVFLVGDTMMEYHPQDGTPRRITNLLIDTILATDWEVVE